MKKHYWLSLENLKNSNNKNEFLKPLPAEDEIQSWNRREFLKLMGASLALTTGACLRRPTEKIVPYVKRPEDVIPGEANFYASSYYDGGEGFSILVKTREGRPIQIQGNGAASLLNGEGLSPRAQAHILSLYDPERIKVPKKNLFNDKKTNNESVNISYEKVDKTIVEQLKKGRVGLLTSRIPSPSYQSLVQEFQNSYSVKQYTVDPLSLESLAQGQKTSYGKELVPSYNVSKAQFIFSLNCDFLGTHLASTDFQKQFAEKRKPTGRMNRLVVLESLMSLTGANADERFRLRPSQQLSALTALTSALEQQGAFSLSPHLSRLVKSYKDSWDSLSIPFSKWQEWALELKKQKGRSLILYGGVRGESENSEALHILVNFLNSFLQNDGRTVNHSQSFQGPFGSYENLEKLTSDLEKGRVKRLIIHKVNPIYMQKDKRFLEALKQAELVVYTGDRIDETGFYSDYVLPDSHDLEKWQDWEFKKGVYSIQQPTIRPLYNTRAFEDALIVWIQASGRASKEIRKLKNFYEYLKKSWLKKGGLAFWNRFLQKGWEGDNRVKISKARAFKLPALRRIPFYKEEQVSSGYELVLYETSGLKHGDLSNVPWIMEFPDPVTKICWDNYLCVSPSLALKEKLKEGEVVAFSLGDKAVEVPVHIQPGQSENTVSLALGYGREKAGSIGNNVGVNAYPFLLEKNRQGRLQKTGKFIPLASVQGHHSMEGRDIILETTLSQFLKDPSSGLHKHHKAKSMWSPHKYKGHKWGMVIDLNSCNGCGTCMIACQSENNIPTVGKKYVLEGREMHWIRVDRYYEGSPESPEVVHQPVVCMHCDNAPCETVCPVMATVHSDEGTNDMIYNRCVGTRYCSNNCPYKVRRFNWFNYEKKFTEPLNLVLNPDVTVRSRGVMEKCSFCIQRIQQGKGEAKREKRPLKDGDVQTACQQACPANAISFGDLNDKKSQVNEDFNSKNSYALLDDMLNTKPAVKYKTKIRNTLKPIQSNKKGH